jgi:hypothetical protein
VPCAGHEDAIQGVYARHQQACPVTAGADARACYCTPSYYQHDQVAGQGAGGASVACWIAVIRSSARSMATGWMLPLKLS